MQSSSFAEQIMGPENKEKFIERKTVAADRCPRELGTLVKNEEVLFHHEVTNQSIWNRF
jgi:glutamine synthetase